MNPGFPARDEYAEYYADYVSRAQTPDLAEALESQMNQTLAFVSRFNDETAGTTRGTRNWSIKEVLGHLCDAERVFSYRAFRFSRADATPLASFEQDDYIAAAKYNSRSLESLKAEYSSLRRATLELWKGLSDEMKLRRGVASGKPVSVRALFHITLGHDRRHLEIMRQLESERQRSATA